MKGQASARQRAKANRGHCVMLFFTYRFLNGRSLLRSNQQLKSSMSASELLLKGRKRKIRTSTNEPCLADSCITRLLCKVDPGYVHQASVSGPVFVCPCFFASGRIADPRAVLESNYEAQSVSLRFYDHHLEQLP